MEWQIVNTLRPRHNGCHFADDIFKCIFFYENVWIPNKISLNFVPKGPINYIPALVQIVAWRRSGDKPLSEPMMVRLSTHICVTQWVEKLLVITYSCTMGLKFIHISKRGPCILNINPHLLGLLHWYLSWKTYSGEDIFHISVIWVSYL